MKDTGDARGIDRRALLGGIVASAGAAAGAVALAPGAAASVVGSGPQPDMPVVNPAHHGAVPGREELAEVNQQAFRAAIDAAAAVHGRVYVPPGIWYHTGPLPLPSHAIFGGAGRGRTVLTLARNRVASGVQLKNAEPMGNEDILVHDLTLDGNRDLQTAALVGATFRRVTGLRLERVEIVRTTSDGLRVLDGCTDVALADFRVSEIGDHGAFFERASRVRAEDVSVEAVALNGLVFFTDCHDLLVRNYRAVDCGRDGIYCGPEEANPTEERISNFVLDGFYVDTCGTHGVDVFATDGAVVTNGRVRNATASASAESHGVNIDDCTDYRISNVNVSDCRRGFGVYDGGDTFDICRNGSFVNCGARGSILDGWVVVGGKDITFTSCIADSNGRFGFLVVTESDFGRAVTNVAFSGCLARQNQAHGFTLDGVVDVTLSACIAENNGQAATNTYHGFSVRGSYPANEAPSERITLSACAAVSTTAKKHKYGFGLTADTRVVRAVGCNSFGHATDAYSMAGRDWMWMGNGFIEMDEVQTGGAGPGAAAPGAPAANFARLFVRDDGAGKSQWVARFNSGAAPVVIATEP